MSIGFEGREECVGDVVDLASVAVAGHSCHVEAGDECDSVDAQVGLSGAAEQADFFRGDGVERVGLAVLAGLHLHEDNILPTGGHDVDFKMVHPPVAFGNRVAVENQFLDNLFLSPFSKFIVSCHVFVALWLPSA